MSRSQRRNNFFRFLLLAGFLIVGSGCPQTYNSSTLDEALFGPPPTGSPEFMAAQAVMRTNCVPCHAYHNMTESALQAAGLVVAADPENSKIYYRLANSSGPNGPKNMPPSGAISNANITIIQTWIINL